MSHSLFLLNAVAPVRQGSNPRPWRPAAAALPSAASDDRWKLALHESGHAVAARALGIGLGMLIASTKTGGGLAGFHEWAEGSPFKWALIAAAGPAAEALAAEHPSPADQSETPPAPASPEPLTGEMEAYLKTRFEDRQREPMQADWQTVRDFAAAVPDSARWHGRTLWINKLARELVNNHASSIVRLAGELFRRSLVRADRIEELLNPGVSGSYEAIAEKEQTEMLSELFKELRNRKISHTERFAKVVKDIAAGKRPAAADVEDVLLKAGKTQEDLADAVARHERRATLARTVGRRKALEREQLAVREKISAADEALKAAEDAHADATWQLGSRLDGIRSELAEVDAAERQLRESSDPVIVEQLDSIRKRLAELSRRRGELRERVSAGKDADELLAAAAETDRTTGFATAATGVCPNPESRRAREKATLLKERAGRAAVELSDVEGEIQSLMNETAELQQRQLQP